MKDAAVSAGYSERSAASQGYHLQKKATISRAIEDGRIQKEEENASAVNIAWVTNELLAIARTAKGVGKLQTWHRAVESIGRHLGYFELDNASKAPVIVIGAPAASGDREAQLRRQLKEAERRQALQHEAVEAELVEISDN